MRPDFGQHARQQRDIAQFVGETATLRAYVSASAGVPQYGIGNEPRYAERTVTGLFRPMTMEEIQAAGGQYIAGDMQATLIDCIPTTADEVIWRGVAYRVESDALPQRIVQSSAQRIVLRRGG
jgi:hypothetical protein